MGGNGHPERQGSAARKSANGQARFDTQKIPVPEDGDFPRPALSWDDNCEKSRCYRHI